MLAGWLTDCAVYGYAVGWRLEGTYNISLLQLYSVLRMCTTRLHSYYGLKKIVMEMEMKLLAYNFSHLKNKKNECIQLDTVSYGLL